MPSIYEIYGSDAHQMTISLMEAAKVSSLIPRNASIALKPNLVIDCSPDSKTCTECDYECLQYSDCALKKCHKFNSSFIRFLMATKKTFSPDS